MAATHGGRVEIDLDVRSDAVIFDIPGAIRAEESKAGRRYATAVKKRRIAGNTDESASGALADELPHPCLAKIPRHGVAAGAGELVDDHDLRSEDRPAWGGVDG